MSLTSEIILHFSLWKAVKTAKDLNTDDLPQTMYEGGIPINKAALPHQLARFFNSKIVELSNQLPVNDAVYNGTKKLEQDNKMFMDKNSIMECILALQTKNSEDVDRIPQRILVDGADILIVVSI